MVGEDGLENILDYTQDELKQWMELNGEKSFRAKQINDWIYKGIFNFDDMKNIPNETKAKLNNSFYIGVPEVTHRLDSKNNDTSKFLLKFKDGNIIECVVMKYDYGNSICISTQVGCRMGCSFCASTIGGLIRSLSSGEMLGEILRAQKEIGERISNIVLMGSGEPLDNYDNVVKFLKTVNFDNGLNIGQRHITLSTCGIVPKIYDLMKENLQITLAISLHAPNDYLRKKIMPIANKYTIDEIINACKDYIKTTKRRVTFEYSLVKDVNDSTENAEELASILKGMLCHVNIIPVNAVKENDYEKPSNHRIKNFSDVLTKFNIENTIRKEMGTDINAACGQLRRNYLNQSNEMRCKDGGDVI